MKSKKKLKLKLTCEQHVRGGTLLDVQCCIGPQVMGMPKRWPFLCTESVIRICFNQSYEFREGSLFLERPLMNLHRRGTQRWELTRRTTPSVDLQKHKQLVSWQWPSHEDMSTNKHKNKKLTFNLGNGIFGGGFNPNKSGFFTRVPRCSLSLSTRRSRFASGFEGVTLME